MLYATVEKNIIPCITINVACSPNPQQVMVINHTLASIDCAASFTSSLDAWIAVAISANLNCVFWKELIGFSNCFRDLEYSNAVSMQN